MEAINRIRNSGPDKKGALYFVGALFIWFACFFLMQGVPIEIRITTATLLSGVFLWVLSPFPMSFTAFLIISVLVLTKAIPLEVGLGGFATGSLFLILSGLMMAEAINETDLATRTAYFVLGRFGGTPRGVLAGILIILLVLGFVVPSSTVRITLLLPTIHTIIENAENEKGNKNISKMLVLGLGFGGTISGSGILPAALSNVITVDLLEKLTGTRILYPDWFIYAFPVSLVLLPLVWLVLLRCFPPEIQEFSGGAQEFQRKFAEMGPLGTKEKKCLVILALTLSLWLTESIHGLHTAVPSMLAVILFSFPGFGFMEWNKMFNINWGTIFLVGFTLSLGTALNSTGTANYLASGFFNGILGGQDIALSPVMAVFLVSAFTQVIHLFLGNVTTLLVTVIPIIVELGSRIGVDPVLLGFVTGMTGIYGFLLPVETITNIVVYGTGYLRPFDMIKPGIILTVTSIIVLTLAAYLWWPLVGLI